MEKLATMNNKLDIPTSSSRIEMEEENEEVPETCLEKLTKLAEEHFKSAFETDPDHKNLFKVFRYFGAAYHSNKSVGEYMNTRVY